MLANVFRPGTHNKSFEVTVCDLEVSANSPSRCAIAPPDASVFMHGLDASLGVSLSAVLLRFRTRYWYPGAFSWPDVHVEGHWYGLEDSDMRRSSAAKCAGAERER